jgi:hypothetical protein
MQAQKGAFPEKNQSRQGQAAFMTRKKGSFAGDNPCKKAGCPLLIIIF